MSIQQPSGILPTLVTTTEAAALFRVNPLTLRKWVYAGTLVDYSITKYRMLLSLDEIKAQVAVRKARGKMTPRGCALESMKGKANAAKAKA